MKTCLILALDSADFGGWLGAVIAVFLLIVGLAITVAWIVFPFIVVSKCNEMIKLLERIDQRPEYDPKLARALHEEAALSRQALNRSADNLGEANLSLQWVRRQLAFQMNPAVFVASA